MSTEEIYRGFTIVRLNFWQYNVTWINDKFIAGFFSKRGAKKFIDKLADDQVYE